MDRVSLRGMGVDALIGRTRGVLAALHGHVAHPHNENPRMPRPVKLPRSVTTMTPQRVSFAGGGTDLPGVFRLHGGERSQKIADAVIRELDKFREDTPITDDQTIVVMKVL